MRRHNSSGGGALPTFFVIGSARSGTTSLHHYLSLHPQIQMSAIKEPHYFAGEPGDLPYGTPRIGRLDDYRALFDARCMVRGESSPSYSAHPRRVGVPGRIKDAVPGARFVYLVRDPISRTVSHYLHRVAVEGERRSIEQALSDLDPSNIYLCASRYATQLEQYLTVFAETRVLVVDQADLMCRRSDTLGRIFAFLGVASDFTSPGFATQFRGSDSWRTYPKWYRSTVEVLARSPLGRLPEPVLRAGRVRLERAILRPLPLVELSPVVRSRLTDLLRPEAERLGRLTDIDWRIWDSWA